MLVPDGQYAEHYKSQDEASAGQVAQPVHQLRLLLQRPSDVAVDTLLLILIYVAVQLGLEERQEPVSQHPLLQLVD